MLVWMRSCFFFLRAGGGGGGGGQDSVCHKKLDQSNIESSPW